MFSFRTLNAVRNGMQTFLKKFKMFNDGEHRLFTESCKSNCRGRSADFPSFSRNFRKYCTTASSSSSSLFPTQYMDVKGKSALVMDGTSGVGFLFADELLKMKATKVIITGLDERTGAEAAFELNKRYGSTRVDFYQIDITNPSPKIHKSDFENMFKHIKNNYGAMDIFINHAEAHEGKDVLVTHMESKIQGILLACKQMKEGGVILNHLSALGLEPNRPDMAAYGAASAGILTACRSFEKNKYFGKTKVRMTTICSELLQMSVGGDAVDRYSQIPLIKSAAFIIKYGPKNTIWLCQRNGILSKIDCHTFQEFTQFHEIYYDKPPKMSKYFKKTK